MALIFAYLSLISRSRPENFRIQYHQKVKVLHILYFEVSSLKIKENRDP
jgi:hypothetical protein